MIGCCVKKHHLFKITFTSMCKLVKSLYCNQYQSVVDEMREIPIRLKKLHVLNIYTVCTLYMYTDIASVDIRHFAYKRSWSVIQPDYVPIQSLFASRLYRECFESNREFTFSWKSATMQHFCSFNEHFLRSIIARLLMSVALIFRIDWVSLADDRFAFAYSAQFFIWLAWFFVRQFSGQFSVNQLWWLKWIKQHTLNAQCTWTRNRLIWWVFAYCGMQLFDSIWKHFELKNYYSLNLRCFIEWNPFW